MTAHLSNDPYLRGSLSGNHVTCKHACVCQGPPPLASAKVTTSQADSKPLSPTQRAAAFTVKTSNPLSPRSTDAGALRGKVNAAPPLSAGGQQQQSGATRHAGASVATPGISLCTACCQQSYCGQNNFGSPSSARCQPINQYVCCPVDQLGSTGPGVEAIRTGKWSFPPAKHSSGKPACGWFIKRAPLQQLNSAVEGFNALLIRTQKIRLLDVMWCKDIIQ